MFVINMFVNKATIETGIRFLQETDADLKSIIQKDGIPPLWNRDPGYATLVRIILEQQVSLASARNAYDRLVATLPDLEPANFLTLDDEQLRKIGFSRQKTSYARNLSEAICRGKLRLEDLGTLEDHAVREQLTKIKGIGDWTADIYLLMALRRPDVWPVSDLALVKSVMSVKKKRSKLGAGEIELIAERWRPWRSVAARILWNHYLLHLNTRNGTS